MLGAKVELKKCGGGSISSHQSSTRCGWGGGEGERYLVPTYSLASCRTVPLGADVIRDSE